MSNTDNPANDEEQLATIPTDYRALLAMTRPLVIEEHTLSSWRGGEICRSGFGISREPRDWSADFTLRRGEIFRSDKSEVRTTEHEGRATGYEDAAAESISALGRRDSNTQIKISLGMS
jgi:hypothetical protein